MILRNVFGKPFRCSVPGLILVCLLALSACKGEGALPEDPDVAPSSFEGRVSGAVTRELAGTAEYVKGGIPRYHISLKDPHRRLTNVVEIAIGFPELRDGRHTIRYRAAPYCSLLVLVEGEPSRYFVCTSGTLRFTSVNTVRAIGELTAEAVEHAAGAEEIPGSTVTIQARFYAGHVP